MLNKLKKYYFKYEEIVNYIVVGVLTTIVSLGTKYILLFSILDASNATQLQISVIISWIFAVCFAFFANKIYVFKSKSNNYIKEFISFVSGRVLTLVLEMIIMWFFVTLLKLDSDFMIIIITILCQVIIMILNYIISKFLVFIKNTNDSESIKKDN